MKEKTLSMAILSIVLLNLLCVLVYGSNGNPDPKPTTVTMEAGPAGTTRINIHDDDGLRYVFALQTPWVPGGFEHGPLNPPANDDNFLLPNPRDWNVILVVCDEKNYETGWQIRSTNIIDFKWWKYPSSAGNATVGGVVLPVDKFVLLAPYISLASVSTVAAVATVIYVKRRKEKQ